MLSVAIPIYNGEEINQALMLFKPVAPITDIINSMRKLISYAAFAVIILASIVSFFLSRTLSRPLIQMNKIATEMAKVNFGNKIAVKSNDEVGLLGTSLNNMSERLKFNINELSHEKAKLENVLDSMSDGVITLDAHGNIILVNPPAKRFLSKYGQDLSFGQNFFNCINLVEFKNLFEEVNQKRKRQYL
ncbi:PAS domain-containing protein [Desulfonispora thiosulfatigenes DSM 11270]|uniref:histidine kinase n=1 Tax=Desulfonispora thiosulfatigenes DSM 11270 TaxID=656914 RepID=A0A1W1V6F8_DESTI|nr:HAMP domain-containing protein [Desulfonispora thiosulfatigenes]SMB88835.1 PAS domain-containing protein [Desulfonispora thiosulfatigenes DSM 11270]